MSPAPSLSSFSTASPAPIVPSWPALPLFDDLPSCEGTPQGCAWNTFSRNSTNSTDVYGTLNLLTEDIVRAARSEVTEGISISLNWELDGMKGTVPARKPLNHTYIRLSDIGFGLFGWDEELSFNTQISSHWDSYCHSPHQGTGVTYNGFRCDDPDIVKAGDGAGNLPTQDKWLLRGGIVGRGVLLDYADYAESKGKEVNPFTYTPITVQDLEATAKAQNVEIRAGDILLVRTGFVGQVHGLSKEAILNKTGAANIGLEPSRSIARWIWDHRIAAVASDNMAVEAIGGNSTNTDDFPSLPLHHWFLTMFGMPIGEMWYLEKLSEHCRSTGKYSFFLTSAPLNVPGLIASPPNALAIF